MMLQEAGEFANHLKKIEKDIRGLKTATEGAGPLHVCGCRAAVCMRYAAVAPAACPPCCRTPPPPPQACSCPPSRC